MDAQLLNIQHNADQKYIVPKSIHCLIYFVPVKPRVIEMPRVRILGEFSDTPDRQFPVATVLQLTCEGQVGNDASKVRAKTI